LLEKVKCRRVGFAKAARPRVERSGAGNRERQFVT
jgi:hypothetical protein